MKNVMRRSLDVSSSNLIEWKKDATSAWAGEQKFRKNRRHEDIEPKAAGGSFSILLKEEPVHGIKVWLFEINLKGVEADLGFSAIKRV